MMLESVALFAPVALSWMLRAALILAVVLLAVRLLERRSAAVRHAVLTAAAIAALVAPPFSALPVTAFIPAQAVTWLGDDPAPNVALPPRESPAIAPLDGIESASLPRSGVSFWGTAVLLWWAGALLLAIRILVASIAAARLRRQSTPVTDPGLLALMKQLQRAPELRVSDRITAPATLGSLRPVVLLPADALSWDCEWLGAVLTHELAHVARRDCLTTMLMDITCAIYWVNPLVWIARRRFVLERERACDDAALNGGAEPMQYGLLLLDVARSACRRPPLPAGVISMARPKELESRLLSIVRGRDIERSSLTRRGLTLIVALSALLGTAAASHATDQPPRRSGEPDLRGDSVAPWTSERLPLPLSDLEGVAARVRASSLWRGPDSLLVRHLMSHVGTTGDAEELYRERAGWALRQARGNTLIEPLLESLGDPDWRVQAYAAWTLGVARERRAVPALLRALAHPVWRMRAMAAAALVQIGDPNALSAMTKALEDEAWQVRAPAVSFVATHSVPVTARRLLEPRLSDRHVAVRSAAADALGASARIP